MNNILLTGYVIALFVLVFWKASFSGKAKLSPEYLNMDQTRQIRAFACLSVILHHLTQRITSYGGIFKGPVTAFNYAGLLFTAIFFFSSGYGLIVSYDTKPDYIKGFLLRRLPAVIVPFWAVNLIGILIRQFIYSSHGNALSYICDFFGLTLINSNGWYIIEIIVLYIAFYILFRLFRNKDAAMVLLSLAAVSIIVFSFFRGHDSPDYKTHWFRGEWWYNSTGVFIFGLFYARFRKKIEKFVNRHYLIWLIVVSILFIAAFCGMVYSVNHLGYYRSPGDPLARRYALITLIVQTVTCILSTTLVLLINMRIILRSRVMRYLGKISAELFLIHGYFITMVFSQTKMSDPVYFAAVLASSIAAGAVISPLSKKLVELVVHLLDRPERTYRTLESELEDKLRERKRKKIKRTFIICLILAGIYMIYQLAGRFIFAKWEYDKECEKIKAASPGDEVEWGYYEQDRNKLGKERLIWIVLAREGDRVCLITKEGIAGSSYHGKHEEVSWEDSDIRESLNSAPLEKIFSRYEKNSIIENDGDLITLLTPAQAEEYFSSDRERELSITPAAEQDGTNINTMSKVEQWDMKGYRSSWWWLRGEKGYRDKMAPVVTVDGKVSFTDKEVNRPGGAIRPVIWIEIKDN